MNIGFNPVRQNNNPKFGMSLKIDKTAYPVIKDHVLKMNEQEVDTFIKAVKGVAERTARNPVDIIIKSSGEKCPSKLVAQVADSELGKELGATETINYIQDSKGGTLFLFDAERRAEHVNRTNQSVKSLLDIVANVGKIEPIK